VLSRLGKDASLRRFLGLLACSTGEPLLDQEGLRSPQKTADLQVFKPSPGLEPGTASLPFSSERGNKGKRGKPRARKSRKPNGSSENA
jgi:hypothetical protein